MNVAKLQGSAAHYAKYSCAILHKAKARFRRQAGDLSAVGAPNRHVSGNSNVAKLLAKASAKCQLLVYQTLLSDVRLRRSYRTVSNHLKSGLFGHSGHGSGFVQQTWSLSKSAHLHTTDFCISQSSPEAHIIGTVSCTSVK